MVDLSSLSSSERMHSLPEYIADSCWTFDVCFFGQLSLRLCHFWLRVLFVSHGGSKHER
jgi:hypothetical protein